MESLRAAEIDTAATAGDDAAERVPVTLNIMGSIGQRVQV